MKVQLSKSEIYMLINAINQVDEYTTRWDNLAGKLQKYVKR
jgi:hypothetical protein